MAGVYAPYYDLLVIMENIDCMEDIKASGGLRQQLKHSFLKLLWKDKHPHNVIVEDPGDAYGFDGHKTNPIRYVTLDITLMGKALSVDFLLVDCKSPYIAIFGRDWAMPIIFIAST